MYSLTIHFGPNAMVWSFLYKEKERAKKDFGAASHLQDQSTSWHLIDDFGQEAVIMNVTGVMLEDMDLVEEARIYRSLANARGEVKARQRAATDPVIRQAQGAGPQVLSPGFRQ